MLLVETRGKFSKGFRVHIVYAQKFLVAKPFAGDQSAVSYGYAVSLSSSPIFDQYSSVVFLRLISTRRPGGGTLRRGDKTGSSPHRSSPIRFACLGTHFVFLLFTILCSGSLP